MEQIKCLVLTKFRVYSIAVPEVTKDVAKPFRGIVLFQIYILTLWFNRPVFDFSGAKIRLELISVLLLVVFYIKNRVNLKNDSFKSGWFSVLRVSGLAWITLSLFTSFYFAPSPFRSLWVVLQIGVGISSMALLLNVRNKDFLIDLANRAIFPLLVLYSTTYIFFALSLNSLVLNQVSSSGRLTGFSYESNILASQAVIWMGVIYQNRERLTRWKNSTFLLLTIVIIGTGTRAAIFALFLILTFHLIRLIKGIRLSGWVIALLVTTILIFVNSIFTSIVLKTNLGNSFGRTFQVFDTNADTAQYRLRVFEIAIEDIRQSRDINKIFGNGTNSFAQLNPLDISKVEEGYLSNVWLATLYDSGIVGFSLFMLFAYSLYRITRPSGFESVLVLLSIAVCATTTSMIWFSFLWISLSFLKVGDKSKK